jgi:hypothetical protein
MALTSASELGQVIQFVEFIAHINTMNLLANQVLMTCNSIALNCVLSIERDNQTLWYSHGTDVSPLEKQVMTMLKEQQRIIEFGTRTVINYPLTSIMVKNMLNDDPERYGRIKDIVPAILTTANGKIESMNSNNELKRQGTDMITTFDKARDSLSGLFDRSHAFQLEVDTALSAMFEELQKNSLTWDWKKIRKFILLNGLIAAFNRCGKSKIKVCMYSIVFRTRFRIWVISSHELKLMKKIRSWPRNDLTNTDGPSEEVHCVERFWAVSARRLTSLQ